MDHDNQAAFGFCIIALLNDYTFGYIGSYFNVLGSAGPTCSSITDPSSTTCELAGILWSLAYVVAAKLKAPVHIDADSTLAIGQAESVYNANHHPQLASLVAALLQTVRTQIAVTLGWVRAHFGHPWSELADSLAKVAAQGQVCTAPSAIADSLIYHEQLEWMWLLCQPESAHAYPSIHGYQLTVTKPDVQLYALPDKDDSDQHVLKRLQLTVLSHNVLSILDPDALCDSHHR